MKLPFKKINFKKMKKVALASVFIVLLIISFTSVIAQQDTIVNSKTGISDTIAKANNNPGDTAKSKSKTGKIQRFYIQLGGFFPLVTTNLRIDGGDGRVGTDIGLEETLGLSQNPSVFKIEGIYQMTKRSAFKAVYFRMNRKKTWIIDRQVTIADTTFDIGANIDYYFNTQYFALNYRYSLIAKKDWQAGLTFGLRWLDFQTGFKLVTDSINKEVNAGIGVPAALLGLHISGNMLPRLTGRYDFEVFKLSISGIDAIVYENKLSLEYYFTKNLGIGGAFNSAIYAAKDMPLSKNFNGSIRYSLIGLSAFAAFRF
jgi:hypothetical protein